MADHNHTGVVWSNATSGVFRRKGPGTEFDPIDSLDANQHVIVFCYSEGTQETFTAADGHTYTSRTWDFVVTSDQDSGGYVADVFINTGGDVQKQLGTQGTCSALRQRLS